MPVKHNTLYGGGYMTYAASINYKSKFGLTTNSLLLLCANYTLNLYYMIIFHAIIGVLGEATGVNYKEIFFPCKYKLLLHLWSVDYPNVA